MKKEHFMLHVVWVFVLFMLSSALIVISLSSHRDPKHPSVPYHYYEPSGPDECTMYLSHERGRKGSHHRFITEKRVFKNWARTFNIRFFQPDWKPEPPAVNHAEDKPVFWGVHAFSPKRKDLNYRLGMGAGQWCRSAPWTEPHSPRPAHPNEYWFSDTAMARNTPGWKYCLRNRNRSSPTPLIAFLYRCPRQKTFLSGYSLTWPIIGVICHTLWFVKAWKNRHDSEEHISNDFHKANVCYLFIESFLVYSRQYFYRLWLCGNLCSRLFNPEWWLECVESGRGLTEFTMLVISLKSVLDVEMCGIVWTPWLQANCSFKTRIARTLSNVNKCSKEQNWKPKTTLLKQKDAIERDLKMQQLSSVVTDTSNFSLSYAFLIFRMRQKIPWVPLANLRLYEPLADLHED